MLDPYGRVMPFPSPWWIPGDSAELFFVGNAIVVGAALYGAAYLALALYWPGPAAPTSFLGPLAVVGGIAIPVNLLYYRLVPCPRNIVVDANGVTVFFGLRKRAFPWARVRLAENVAVLHGSYVWWVDRVKLSWYQAQVLRAIIGA